MNEDIYKRIGRFEKELEIPENFFRNLLREDDWTFIIKLHSLLEGAITFLIATHVNIKELRDFFERLELSNKNTGKIVIVSHLNLLEKSEISYIQSLSELRNKLVHDVKNVNFYFKQYFGSMNKQQKIKNMKNFGIIYDDDLSENAKREGIDFFNKKPKFFLWLNAMLILLKIYNYKELISLKREIGETKNTKTSKDGLLSTLFFEPPLDS